MEIIIASRSELYKKLNMQNAKFGACFYIVILYRNNTKAVSMEVVFSCRRGDTRDVKTSQCSR